MTSITLTGVPAATQSPEARLGRAAIVAGYLALVVIYLGFGLSKFTPEEAAGLVGIVKPSPFLGWVYGVASPEAFSRVLGVIELSIGALIAARLVAPRLAFFGGLLSAGLFLMTQSMLLSTPGALDLSKGLLYVVGGAGQFLLKDAGLFAVSLLIASEALAASKRR
ncbi:hypothetical protein IP88_08570 [alpha proteobacterium AAP81b]|nr:hypothetical protein IP88_08570 [alpha proteobacterium AAP81b]